MLDLSAQSTDGHRFGIRLFEQKDRKAPLVVICPAMGVQGKYYAALATALQAEGLQAATFDLRGQGSSALRASRAVNWGYATMVEQDFPALLDALHTEAPLAPVYFWGHSQGGQLACLFMAANPEAASGAVLVACGSVYFRCWPVPQNLKILVQTQILRMAGLLCGYMPGEKMGFAGRQARDEISDWADCALNGRYDLRNTKTDYEAALRQQHKPVWAFSLEGDDYAPRAATAYLLGKMPATATQHQHLAKADLPEKALHHFYWVKQAEGLVRRALPLFST